MKKYEYTDIHLRQMCQRARTAIRLKGKIDQNVKTYYVYCSKA